MKRSIITTIAVLLLIVFYSCNNAKIDNSANLERIKTLDTLVSLSLPSAAKLHFKLNWII